MIRTLFVLILLSSTYANSQTAFNIEEAKKRCQGHFTQSAEVYWSDFKWGYTLLEMADRFDEFYESGKRLFLHSYYDKEEKQFLLFYDDKKHLPVPITENFIKSVTLQIETAIEKGYADYVFFPDMGHSHLHFPQDHWDNHYAGHKMQRNDLYKKMLADKKMKALYHLTEQLQMTDENDVPLEDEILNFKYWNRNFLGYNKGTKDYEIKIEKEKKYNTVGSIEGHKSYSAGFLVSASKEGCFPFKDKDGNTRYFDIGLKDLRRKPSLGAQEPSL